jgi:predicted NodU family carbamoyl transferase
MIILGLNAFHVDSAVALVREEERFRRVKHWAGFPSKAVAYCLREAGLALSDVHPVAVNQDSRANKEEAKAMTAAFVRLRKRQRKNADQFGRIIVWRWPHKEAPTFPRHPRRGGVLGVRPGGSWADQERRDACAGRSRAGVRARKKG